MTTNADTTHRLEDLETKLDSALELLEAIAAKLGVPVPWAETEAEPS